MFQLSDTFKISFSKNNWKLQTMIRINTFINKETVFFLIIYEPLDLILDQYKEMSWTKKSCGYGSLN